MKKSIFNIPYDKITTVLPKKILCRWITAHSKQKSLRRNTLLIILYLSLLAGEYKYYDYSDKSIKSILTFSIEAKMNSNIFKILFALIAVIVVITSASRLSSPKPPKDRLINRPTYRPPVWAHRPVKNTRI